MVIYARTCVRHDVVYMYSSSVLLDHSAPLDMRFCMESFFAEVKIFHSTMKTMDYSKAFWPKLSSFFVVLLLRNGRCYEAEIRTTHSLTH